MTTENFVINKRLRSQKSETSPVLVIDDLERISREIHISDLMGFLLTDIIESYGYKVIIVGNTKEIREDEIDEFNATCEKVVSRVFPFTYDLNNVRQEFFQSSGNLFLQEDAEWLVGIVSDYALRNKGRINLRTLEFILSTFKIIDKGLTRYLRGNVQGGANQLQIRQSAFANLFVIATEYREGKLTRENISSIDQILNTRSFFFWHLKDDEEKSEAEEIALKYHADMNLKRVIMYDKSVNEAVFSGVFDATTFIESWMRLFNPSGTVSTLDRISEFRDMDDNQLKGLECQLLEDSRKSDVSIADILSATDKLIFFEHNDLYFCNEDYLSVLLEALEEAVGRAILKSETIYDLGEIKFRYRVLAEDKDILTRVLDILEYGEKVKQKLRIEKLLNAIFSDDYNTIRDIVRSGKSINVFREVLDSYRLNCELLTAKSKAHLLDRYLISEYTQISNSKDFHPNETADILELTHVVEAFVDKSQNIGHIDRFNLRSLLITLKEILDKFSE